MMPFVDEDKNPVDAWWQVPKLWLADVAARSPQRTGSGHKPPAEP